MTFRIQPDVWHEEPIQRTFENVKQVVNAAVLTMRFEMPVDSAMTALELSSVRKIPYLMNQVDQTTTPIWERGALVVEAAVVAQGVTFSVVVHAAKKDQAPVVLLTVPGVVAAGPKLYRTFSGMVANVDLRGYEAIAVGFDATAPAVADRYTITTQLSFYPFEGFA